MNQTIEKKKVKNRSDLIKQLNLIFCIKLFRTNIDLNTNFFKPAKVLNVLLFHQSYSVNDLNVKINMLNVNA